MESNNDISQMNKKKKQRMKVIWKKNRNRMLQNYKIELKIRNENYPERLKR